MIGNEKIRILNGQKMIFKYPELVYNHYRYIQAAAYHNNR